MKKEKRARARRTGAQAAESGAARPAGGAGKTLRALGFAQKLTLAMLLVLAWRSRWGARWYWPETSTML